MMMTSICQLTIRPRLGPLGCSSQLASQLLKRSSQRYARPSRMFSPPQRENWNSILRRPTWSSRRSYYNNYQNHYTSESFWARNKPEIVAGGLIGLCCGTFCFQWTAARLAEQGDHAFSDLVRRNFISSAENIREGRWWVLITSSFAHVNLTHLAFNGLALWGFAGGCVQLIGVPYFLLLWVCTASTSSAAQIGWQNRLERLRKEMVGRRWDKAGDSTLLGIPISRERALAISGGSGALGVHYGGSEGASGVICGLTGLLLCLRPRMPIRQFIFLPMPLWLAQVVFVAGSAYCMATGSLPVIGHAAHLGGTAAGIAYYYAAARPLLRRTGRF